MIEVEEVFLPINIPTIIDDIRITPLPNRGERPASVAIKKGQNSIEVLNFVGLRFDKKTLSLTPICSVTKWKNIHIISGLTSFVISTPSELFKLDLFRLNHDDPGFYTTQWIEKKDILICIYESGVFALGATGSIFWHYRKYWDDIFLSLEDETLTFLTEKEGHFKINIESGVRTP